MYNCRVLSNLYFHYSPLDDFESHMVYLYNNSINRGRYKIVDLIKWVESDFEEGEIFIVERVSKNGKYNFNRYLKGV